MKDITRLYDKDLLCSECFIQIWRQRLMSSKLPKDEFTDYLLEQYESIQKFCSVSLPVSTYSSTLFIRPTIPTSTVLATAVPSTPATTNTCDGQLVVADDDNRLPCLRMSDTYNVSTGTLEYITGSYSCSFEGAICLPKPCELDIVYGSNTCEALAAKYSTDESPVSLTQFLAWNPYLQGSCDRVNHVQRVCKGPPGGRFKPSGVIAAPTGPGEYYTTAHPAEPTQPGTTESCGRYYKVASGDTCNSIALRLSGITVPTSGSTMMSAWLLYPQLPCPRMAHVGHLTVTVFVKGPHLETAAPRVDTAEPGLNTAALATVYPAHANPITAPRQTGPVAQTGAIQRAVIQASAVAAQSTGTAATERNFVGQDYATPGNVTQTWEAQALMESVAPALQGTRLVLEPSLETAAR
ncbi:hypothetical protein N8T08_003659 [Aspergillus melleus]|uniref:Uncharacterized protein n=1 Tax=Aspergillus melleus TaxID=138277 RepID=A0ACC3B6V7_9EURO|nr:hypothetical protein N8T08_003659 [Aspergillus melleus]